VTLVDLFAAPYDKDPLSLCCNDSDDEDKGDEVIRQAIIYLNRVQGLLNVANKIAVPFDMERRLPTLDETILQLREHRKGLRQNEVSSLARRFKVLARISELSKRFDDLRKKWKEIIEQGNGGGNCKRDAKMKIEKERRKKLWCNPPERVWI
jgi:hypothetical protein